MEGTRESKILNLCISAKLTEDQGVIECGLGLFGKFPHVGVCQYCITNHLSTKPAPIAKREPTPQEIRAAKRLEICKACDKWIADKCSISSGCGNCHRKRICPNIPPKWGPGIDE